MANAQGRLIGHWRLAGDGNDSGPERLTTQVADVTFGEVGPDGKPNTAARFNGKTSQLLVADHPSLQLGSGDFTLSLRIKADDPGCDVVGSLLGKFDTDTRRGWNLDILTASGVVSTGTANYRQLQFGIDADVRDATWRDEGRPGNAAKIGAITSIAGRLFVGTMELGAAEVGRLWRYEGGGNWTDLGNPLGTNSVTSIIEHEGQMYVGVSRYKPMGSALGPTLNMKPGGRVFRVTSDGQWEDQGQPGGDDAVPESTPTEGYNTGKADSVYALTSFKGRLYCTSPYRHGVYRHEGGQMWRQVGLSDLRMFTLTIHRGQLYSLINGGAMYRTDDGEHWTNVGTPEGSSQNYGALIHQGSLHVGTWPRGEVFRFDGGQWVNHGRAGYEMEIMGGVHYNGSAYWGTLPMANVYRMDRRGYTLMGQLDDAPVVLRRVWTMATHEGRIFAGTLPSGRVWSMQAGRSVTWDHAFPSGWRHVVATRSGRHMLLYVDGELVSRSDAFEPGTFNLDNPQPLRIGCGAYEHFQGMMSDVRIYDAAVAPADVHD